jgi:polysaccharide deacetylase 2 family uncharacterized protein YibQ
MRRLVPLAPLLLIAAAGGPDRLQAEERIPRVALIIDDFGCSFGETARAFLEMDADLTISVLPGEPFTGKVARTVLAEGKDLLLHLPMEPLGYPAQDPGPRAVLLAQTDDEVRARVRSALDGIEGLVGVSNHMGSRAMQEERILRILLGEVGERGLFFLDSKTFSGDLATTVAGSMGVRCLENDLFWDTGVDEREAIRAKLDRLVGLARRRGYAIGIGHPRPVTLEVLREKLPEMERLGVRRVPIRDLAAASNGSSGTGLRDAEDRLPAAADSYR